MEKTVCTYCSTCNARVSFLLDTEEREEIFFPGCVDVDVIYRPILEAEKGPAPPPTSWKPRPMFDQLVTAATPWILLPMGPG